MHSAPGNYSPHFTEVETKAQRGLVKLTVLQVAPAIFSKGEVTLTVLPGQVIKCIGDWRWGVFTPDLGPKLWRSIPRTSS
jgi:hypothetical protein